MYISLLFKQPLCVEDKEFENISCSFKGSVYNKVEGISKYFKLNSINKNMCLLLINYRNALVHSSYNKKNINNNIKNFLISSKSEIKETFKGLIIDKLIESVENKKNPKFKEVASLINASHMFVNEIDKMITSNITPDYFEKAVIYYLSKNEKAKRKYLCFNKERRKKFVKNVLQNHFSFSGKESELKDCILELTSKKIKKASNINQK